jgi:hypothetical protein
MQRLDLVLVVAIIGRYESIELPVKVVPKSSAMTRRLSSVSRAGDGGGGGR